MRPFGLRSSITHLLKHFLALHHLDPSSASIQPNHLNETASEAASEAKACKADARSSPRNSRAVPQPKKTFKDILPWKQYWDIISYPALETVLRYHIMFRGGTLSKSDQKQTFVTCLQLPKVSNQLFMWDFFSPPKADLDSRCFFLPTLAAVPWELQQFHVGMSLARMTNTSVPPKVPFQWK